MAENLTVLTGCTRNYSGSLNVLLSSLNYSNPDVQCRVFCFGWEGDLIDSFRAKHNADFLYVSVSDETKNNVSNNVRCGDALRLKVKCINDYTINGESAVLWIDADSLVTGDLTTISSKIFSEGYDVICTMRKHRKLPHEVFALGVLGFSGSEESIQFLSDFYERVKITAGVDGWFHDQLEFYRVFSERRPKFYSLRKNEHTMKGVLDSIIYSRRETISETPLHVAELHGIPIKAIDLLPENIYPL